MPRIPSANPYTFVPTAGQADPYAASRGQLTEQQRIRADNMRLPNFFRNAAITGIGAAATAGAAPFLFGGGAAASGAGAAGGAASGGAGVGAGAGAGAAATGGRWTLGNVLRMAEVGVPAITGIFGQRSNNRALDRQAAAEQAALEQQLAFAREQEMQRRAEAERMFVEEQRRWEAEERNRQRQLAAEEEERAFARRQVEDREARRAQTRIRLDEVMQRGRRR